MIFRLCYSITFDISMNTPIEWWQSCYLMSCMNYKCFTWISWINSWKIYEHMNMNRGKSMNPWIWICPKAVNPWISNAINLWTHELHLLKIHEPVNMNTYIALNSWIWILIFPWTREYEHGNLLHELLKVHTAHKNPWTIPWTPWIVMREKNHIPRSLIEMKQIFNSIPPWARTRNWKKKIV